MANSYVEIPVTGVDSYAFPFPYIEQSHINVYAGGVLQTQGVHYTFTDSNTIEFSVGNAPTDTNTVILIKRVTDASGRLVTYSNTGLDADDLNLGSKQNFFLAQEAIDVAELNVTKGVDGITSVNGRLTDVEDPIGLQDAATKAYVVAQLAASEDGGIYIQDQAPSDASEGDLWVDTDTNVMSVLTPTGWANGGTTESTVYHSTGADVIPFGLFFIIPDLALGAANIDQVFLNGVFLKECTTTLDYTTGDWDRTSSVVTFENALAADDVITITTYTRMSSILQTAVMDLYSKLPTLLQAASANTGSGLTLKETFVATLDQTVFTLQNTYILNANNIAVYVNGVRQSEYIETDASTITFTRNLRFGDEVEFFINEFDASVIEQTIVNQAEDARDEAIAAKDEINQSIIDVTDIRGVVSVNGDGNISTITGSASVRIEGGTSTNYLSALTSGGVEEEVFLWTDAVIQVMKPINLVSPNGLVAKQLTINNLGQLVFDGTVIS